MSNQPKPSRVLTVEQIRQKFAHLKVTVSLERQRRVRDARARLAEDEQRADGSEA